MNLFEDILGGDVVMAVVATFFVAYDHFPLHGGGPCRSKSASQQRQASQNPVNWDES